MNNEKNSLLRDSRGVIATAKGLRLLEAGFFDVMKTLQPITEIQPDSSSSNQVEINNNLEQYLEAGLRAFEPYARKLAEIEQATELEPGSFVDAILSGSPLHSPQELAWWITQGWDCSETQDEICAIIRPVWNSWQK